MQKLQEQLTAVVASDPAVAKVVSTVGGTRAPNQGFVYAALKPLDERKISAMQIVDRLRPKLKQVVGASLVLAPTRTSTWAGGNRRACSNTRCKAGNQAN